MRKTVVIHNPRPLPPKGKKMATKKKKTARKAPAKKKRRNPAPATVANPRKRKRTRKNPAAITRYNGAKVVHHRRRTKRRNPSGMPWGDILTAAGVGLAVPVVGQVAAQLAMMEPTRTKLYMRIAGALAAIAGGYLLTQRKHTAIGVALIGGGAATAFQNDLSIALFKLVNRGQAPGTAPVASQQAAIQGLVEEEMGALREIGALAEIGALSEPDLAEYAARLERMQAMAPAY